MVPLLEVVVSTLFTTDIDPSKNFVGPFWTLSGFWKVESRASGTQAVSISLNLLLFGTFSRIFDESTFSKLLRACPRNIVGVNLAGDFSLAAASLSSDDFSFGEGANLSSCSNIFSAISLDWEGTWAKLIPGTLLYPFSISVFENLCLDSPNKRGFSIKDKGSWATSERTPVPVAERGLPPTAVPKLFGDKRLGFWRIRRMGPTDPISLSRTELLRFRSCK